MKTWGIAVSDAHTVHMETEWVDGELMCDAQRMIQPRLTGKWQEQGGPDDSYHEPVP